MAAHAPDLLRFLGEESSPKFSRSESPRFTFGLSRHPRRRRRSKIPSDAERAQPKAAAEALLPVLVLPFAV